ncbi:ThiF family adenylyltransferase [Sulfoacidibacillus ferrooxidans]|uniref:THIF-type NAD/FAD binding fold domain-containing protein n=1 Tax=Sulfoacidibacillus ferrooxidans TaxID=2005001 RepID=A0A9X1VCJ8_9BACL|nr:ThiF family adenylyltransferase [Sulfoacidibacillus ferrooxidans]MCI0184820.1 hypothetical protein [Sulfoacidibacillus ferrooxidans]
MINLTDFDDMSCSVAMTHALDAQLRKHFHKGTEQEDLTFALWRPSRGHKRYTVILERLVLPLDGERQLHGNVSFSPDYVQRVLKEAGNEYGIALLHSHLGPGWQGMSEDDIVAERDRLAAAVSGRTGHPLVGLTWGTDGAWSARAWLRHSKLDYRIRWANTVRVVGKELRITYHPDLTAIASTASQVATVSCWGEENQSKLANVHVGIIGLGSVGSVVAETLSRMGISRVTLIDHDRIEERNLDRTLGAVFQDAVEGTAKVDLSKRLIESTHTALTLTVTAVTAKVTSDEGLRAALDCDVLFSCVDRSYPRHILNALAYGHLIPVVDGGIFAKVAGGKLVHADWRIHIVGPEHACMMCLGAITREGVALDREGKLDDPTYIEGLGSEFSPLLARQNVFPFSVSVAAHEVIQFVGLVTGVRRLGGMHPQFYHCYPGEMESMEKDACIPGCEYHTLTSTVCSLLE